jgi:hypothetical protein
MIFHEVIATTASLEQRIHDLVTWIQDEAVGHSQISLECGEVYVYDKSDQLTALSREYITGLVGQHSLDLRTSTEISKWPSLPDTVNGVNLNEPIRIPVLLRQIIGTLIISKKDTGVIIPVRDCKNTPKEEIIRIRSGNNRVDIRLEPRKIIIVSGDDDVSITVPTDMPYHLTLHPKSPSKSPEK